MSRRPISLRFLFAAATGGPAAWAILTTVRATYAFDRPLCRAFFVGHAEQVLFQRLISHTLWVGHGAAADKAVDLYFVCLCRRFVSLKILASRLRTMRGRGSVLEACQ